MKKNHSKIINIFLLLFILLLFLNKSIINLAIINASNLFITKVFPYLFIMIIIQNLLLNYNITYYLTKVFKKNISFALIILSIILGSPSNILFISNLNKQKILTDKEANHLAGISLFNNPLFLFNILSLAFPLKEVIIILITTYLSPLLQIKQIEDKKITYYYPKGFFQTTNESIKKAINITLNIYGTICFFFIINNLLQSFISIKEIKVFLSGILEITQGLNNLSLYNIASNLKILFATLFISFGGLSIHMQIYEIIKNTNIKYQSFLLSRLKTTLIAIILLIIFNLF